MLKKCKCGSIDFEFTETINHAGQICEDDGKLTCGDGEAGGFSEEVICSNCKKVYDSEKFEIEFC